MKYLKEHRQFILDNYKGITTYELANRMSQHFGITITMNQMKTYLSNHRLRNGVNGQFKKGECRYHTPKGTRNSPRTEFKKGHTSHNKKSIGYEHMRGDGYIWIKIAEPSKWQMKHRILWESIYGPLPQYQKILHLDGNKVNNSLDNLVLIDNAAMARMNQCHMIYNDSELTKTGLLIANLLTQTAIRKRGGNHRGANEKRTRRSMERQDTLSGTAT